jgi:hypothetical protein
MLRILEYAVVASSIFDARNTQESGFQGHMRQEFFVLNPNIRLSPSQLVLWILVRVGSTAVRVPARVEVFDGKGFYNANATTTSAWPTNLSGTHWMHLHPIPSRQSGFQPFQPSV